MHHRRIMASLVALLLVFQLLPSVSAQQREGGSGLSISPTRAELTIKPGKADNIQITLKNISGIDIKAYAQIDDFEADNTTGEPRILVNAKSSTPTSIKKFLVGVTDIDLSTNETKKFDIPIQIPEGATSGSYYGVIRYTAQARDKQTAASGKQVSLNASLGLIVLIQVPGSIREQIQAQKISVERNGSNGSIFFAPPQKANVTFKNIGNGFSKPYGRVTITKGGKEVYHYEMNNTDPRSNILPGATRIFTDEIKNVSSLGRYTIVSGVSYGSGGEVLTLKTSFWVFPVSFVLMCLGVVLLIGGVGFMLYRRISKSHRRRFK